MSRNRPIASDPRLESDSHSAAAARFSSLRAVVLLLFTVALPAIALLGPSQIYDWLFPPAINSPAVATTSDREPDDLYAMHYGEETQPVASGAAAELAASERLQPPGQRTTSAPREWHDSAVQPALHATAEPSQAEAEYLFRESSGGPRDQMQQIQQRLQLLGAQYMVLETWGDVTPRYRFYCRMPSRQGGTSEHESISTDPLQAMQSVLSEVQQRVARR